MVGTTLAGDRGGGLDQGAADALAAAALIDVGSLSRTVSAGTSEVKCQ
jgi:hypothetical protein